MAHDFVADEPAPVDGIGCPIPVSIVTGFLGSGKTTLISRILRDPAFGRTAVIVNEFGEVGLDHDLIASSDDSVLTLNTGCLCCAVQTDLARTLMGLLQRREVGLVDYDRVLIETSGLSDPAPMLQAMMTDSDVFSTHRVTAVVTLVDAVHGAQTLLEHAEARQQVVLADRILISKTDLQASLDHLLEQLDTLNPGVPRMTTSQANPSTLFSDTSTMTLSARIVGASRRRGHSEIETFTIIRDRPLPALALTMLLESISEHCGSRMLRLKGLVAIREMPGQPAVIHGVRHVVNPPDFLDRWPNEDERTRIVFIGRGLPRYFIPRLLEAIEEEICDAIGDP
ncbi:GTP-binding protein [Acidisphaera sp. S103]|uniref:CobW family GTP-binding protein n=1 Tax=Acidisphaera sp. S103 TaxID=1747223 RepID=UPI00131C2202|nr:GTP-binding protein [Acidisphaera sp. S103]